MPEYIFNNKDIETVNDSLLELKEILSEISENISGLFSGFDAGELIEGTTNLAANLGTILTSMKDLSLLNVDFTDTLKPIGKLFTNFGEVLGTVLTPLSAILSIVLLLGGGFVYLMETSEEFRTRVEEIMNEIGEMFNTVWTENIKPIIDTFNESVNEIWTEHLKPLLENCGEFVLTLLEIFSPIVAWIFDLVSTCLSPVIQWTIDILGKVLIFVIDMVDSIIEIANGVIKFLSGIFTLNFKKAFDGLKRIGEGFTKGIWAILAGFINIVMGAVSGVLNTGIGAANAIIKNVINPIIKAINNLIGTNISTMKTFSSFKFKTATMPKLATGGLVSPGQMFIAREAGPELVGSLGSQTAVMNNNQIVASVAGGVYRAQAEQNRILREILGQIKYANANGTPISIKLDGREVCKSVIKNHNRIVRQTGMSPLHI